MFNNLSDDRRKCRVVDLTTAENKGEAKKKKEEEDVQKKDVTAYHQSQF
jgi:hypothetical protein